MRSRLAPLTALFLLFTAQASARPRIMIDPGHGGRQEGAVGPGGVQEKDLALILSRKLKDHLEKSLNADVSLTREGDVDLPLAERVERANARKPDLFISVHLNSMPTKKHRERTEGVETYFLSASASGDDADRVAARENADGPAMTKATGSTLDFILNDLARSEAHVDSSRLAYSVHQALISGTGAADRGVQQAPFFVLTGIDVPAVLVEVGFISHPDEGRRLQDPRYQAKIAESISKGVGGFLTQVAQRDRPVRTRIARP